MAKYIDADKLKAKLDEHYRNYQSKYTEARNPYTRGLIDALDLAEQVINSLQQEQQEVDLEKEIEDYWIATGWSKVMTLGKFKVIARYFYGLGQLNSK